ncbi:MAG: Periplasmic binding protein [Thermoanaerobacterales bacterium 50_218]|nr:MAG: Periplasmic binding protein [Thermoanaerobacterales bacterium 50_218]HAA89408.1 hypothetical protein [Peptococcaceae bacterium]
MKGQKIVPLIMLALIFILLASLSFSCAQGEEKEASSKIITITDAAGRVVEIPSPLNRVIAIGPGAHVAMKAIGVNPDKIVGIPQMISEEKILFPELFNKPIVTARRWWELNFEKIIELKPQVVIVDVKTTKPEVEDKLEGMGIKVVRLDFHEPETMESNVKILGKMFGREQQAEEFAKFWSSELMAIQKKIQHLGDNEKVRLYLEDWRGGPYHASTEDSSYGQLAKMVGAVNIAHGYVGGSIAELSAEYIIKENPQVIVKISREGGFGNTDQVPLKEAREEIMEREGFRMIEAVKEGRVYVISNDVFGGAFKNIGACYLAKVFYPELFKELDPQKYLKEYLEKYLGVKYEDAKGVFIYPELT